MFKFLRRGALVIAVMFAATGCGGSSKHTVLPIGLATPVSQSPTAAQTAKECPKGVSYMGCSVSQPPPGFIPPSFAASGCKVPDVSNWQGHPNWDAAKGSICGAVFKAGEYSTDPDAQYNADALARLHIWHALYWFVRNTGCSHEAAQIIAAAHQFHVTVVANDLETPEAAGYGGCLVPAEKAAHLIPIDYTAPGTWPGGAGFGGAPLWQAEYGSTLHPFWHPVVAWQCTDGHYGCVTNIPGIGQDDVSINMGITSLGAASKPTGPVCFGKSWQHTTLCNRVRAQDKARGTLVARERGYLKVSQANSAKLQARVAGPVKQLNVIDARSATELRNHKYGALRVSAINAGKIQVQIAPVEKQLAAVMARAKLEQGKISSTQAALDASLKQYGFHS